MSRIATNTAEYFPHYAKQGKTIFILYNRYQTAGYAFWYRLLELLCVSENHFYDFSAPENEEYLYSFCYSNAITGPEILILLAKLGNIDPEMFSNKIIWCQALVNNLSEVYKKRSRPVPSKPILGTRKGITGPESKTNEPSKIIPGPEMPQSKVEYSKEKYIKEEKSIDNTPKIHYGEFKNVLLTPEDYAKLIGKLGQVTADSLIERLSSYIASKGKKYHSHYATLLSWDRMDKKDSPGARYTGGNPDKFHTGKFAENMATTAADIAAIKELRKERNG